MKFKVKPFPHQQEIFDRQKDAEIFALLWDRGLGKSKEIIDTAAHLYLTGKIRNLIVIGPKSAFFDWKIKHIPDHMPDDVTDYVIHEWRGASSKKEDKELLDFVKLTGKFKILTVNIDAFSHSKIEPWANMLMKSGETMICIDESHFIKTSSAIRTKTVKRIFKDCKYKRIATGTMLDKVEDVYAQFDFLRSGCLGFKHRTAFNQRYCVYKRLTFGPRSFDKCIGYKNLDELRLRIDSIGSILDKSQVFDLPPKIYQTVHVELTPQQRAHYKNLEKTYLTYINSAEVEVTTALTMAMKLHQITCGVIHGPDGNKYKIEGANPKIDAIKDILDEGAKSIIFCNISSNFTLENLYAELMKCGYRCVKFYGECTQDERKQAIKDFQEGAAQVFIGNTSAAEGITLTKAKNVIYFSNNYQLIKRDQGEDRSHRYGVEHPVNIIDIVAIDTIDEIIVEALTSKKSVRDSLLKYKERSNV